MESKASVETVPVAESPFAGRGAGPVKPGHAKVAIRFVTQFKDRDLVAAIARILAGMTGNAAYPSPSPSLAELTAVRDAFEVAVLANDGGTRAVVARDQAREPAEAVLRELAAYVQHACKGDLLTLLGSGFPAQRPRGAPVVQPVQAPVGLKLRRGKASGQVFLRCTPVETARLYQWRFASVQAPNAWTVTDTTTAASFTLEGLAAGTQYLLQVRAFGLRGSSDWSDSMTYVAS